MLHRNAVQEEEHLARFAAALVLRTDRRQGRDRRKGPARGGRRETDPAREPLRVGLAPHRGARTYMTTM